MRKFYKKFVQTRTAKVKKKKKIQIITVVIEIDHGLVKHVR